MIEIGKKQSLSDTVAERHKLFFTDYSSVNGDSSELISKRLQKIKYTTDQKLSSCIQESFFDESNIKDKERIRKAKNRYFKKTI